MRRYLLKRYYSRQFDKAVRILTKQYARHKDAGHEVYLTRDENEVSISLYCVNCTESQPLRRKEQDKIHIYRTSDGKPYNG